MTGEDLHQPSPYGLRPSKMSSFEPGTVAHLFPIEVGAQPRCKRKQIGVVVGDVERVIVLEGWRGEKFVLRVDGLPNQISGSVESEEHAGLARGIERAAGRECRGSD